MPHPATRRGRETRQRIVATAADLMYAAGVDSTSLDDVLAASGTGKGQLYHYFSGKEELVGEVLDHQLDSILAKQNAFSVDTWTGLRAWFDTLLVDQQVSRVVYGCPLGSLVGPVLDHGQPVRGRATAAFARWEAALTERLTTMVHEGRLRPDADPAALAETTIAIIQGGYFLSAVKRDARPLRGALFAALSNLRSFAD